MKVKKTYFISPTQILNTSQVTHLTEEEGKIAISDFLDGKAKGDLLPFDVEASGLDCYKDMLLLFIVGTKNLRFVISANSVDLLKWLVPKLNDYRILGVNLKYDFKMVKADYFEEFNPRYFFDCMLAEQRIFQNITSRRAGLKDLALNYLGINLDKEERSSFIGQRHYRFTEEQIVYAADDVDYLEAIQKEQQIKIDKYDYDHLLYNIEFPLLRVLGESEMVGFKLDVDGIRKNVAENLQKKYETECKLDEEFRRLRDKFLKKNDPHRYICTGGKWDADRKMETQFKQVDLFSDPDDQAFQRDTSTGKKLYINYGSAEQMKFIFAVLKQPMVTKKHGPKVPRINHKGKVKKSSYDFTTDQKLVEVFIAEYPNSPMVKFLKLLSEQRGYQKAITSYGENLIAAINPVTGKLHTIFRQASSATGRLKSGDMKNGYYNAQQIPREDCYRHCFGTDEGREIYTGDLSGAELIIICSKSQDEKLIELSKGDMHSHFATEYWKEIALFRGNDYDYDRDHVSKKNNPEKRQIGKNCHFGTFYGMASNTAAKILGITGEEGGLVLRVMRRIVPKVFNFMDKMAKFSTDHGYIILNDRTNARMWYPAFFIAKNNHSTLDFGKKIEIESSARNSPIQGTQADMIKEAMVEIAYQIDEQQLDIRLLKQVHDELVYDWPVDGDNLAWFYPDEGERERVTFKEFVDKMMVQVANRYLNGIEMECESVVKPYWTK